MIKAKAIGLAVFVAFLAVAECTTEMLSDVAEQTRKTYKNQTSTLDQAHTKCAEHLKSKLGEFLQKVPKEINNDGTQKLGKLVEEKLNKEINVLMGSCDPTTVGAAQFIASKVEPKGNSLTVQQLVIQKIHLKPSLKEVKNETTSSSAGSLAERGLMSKSDCDDLVAEWERQLHQLEVANMTLSENELRLKAQLAELNKLREENEALIRSLNSSHLQEVGKIEEDISEINRLTETVVLKDMEITRLKLEKTTLEETIQRFSGETSDLKTQLKNLNSRLNQTNSLKPELEQCQFDRDKCSSSLAQKRLDCKSSEDNMKICEAKLSNCQQEIGQQSANFMKCVDDMAACQKREAESRARETTLTNEKLQMGLEKANLQAQVSNLQNSNNLIRSNCNKSLSSIQFTLEEEKTRLVFMQTQYETSKTESDSCRSRLRQMEINGTQTENDLKLKLKTCESAKTICETSTKTIKQELAGCKEDAAVITADNSKKNGAITKCETDKTKSSNELSNCLTIRNSLAKAIAGKIKIQEQLDQINVRNKDTDLSLLTVISSQSDARQQSIARLILDEKSAWTLKTTCTP